VTARRRLSNSAGTYDFIGVLRRPSQMFKRPSPEQGLGDLEAVQRGETRKVSCFLRGSFAPYPHRLRQGTLYLSAVHAQWKPFWSLRRSPQLITGPVLSVTTRPADHREPNVKQGGSGLVNVPSFTVITCQMTAGAIDLVVPSADDYLMTSYFKSASREHGQGLNNLQLAPPPPSAPTAAKPSTATRHQRRLT
jgi:hypothetical protein